MDLCTFRPFTLLARDYPSVPGHLTWGNADLNDLDLDAVDRALARARDLVEKNRTLILPIEMEIASRNFSMCVLLTSQSISDNVQRPSEPQTAEYGLNH